MLAYLARRLYFLILIFINAHLFLKRTPSDFGLSAQATLDAGSGSSRASGSLGNRSLLANIHGDGGSGIAAEGGGLGWRDWGACLRGRCTLDVGWESEAGTSCGGGGGVLVGHGAEPGNTVHDGFGGAVCAQDPLAWWHGVELEQ